jgi:hypothetical protein
MTLPVNIQLLVLESIHQSSGHQTPFLFFFFFFLTVQMHKLLFFAHTNLVRESETILASMSTSVMAQSSWETYSSFKDNGPCSLASVRNEEVGGKEDDTDYHQDMRATALSAVRFP